MPDSGCSANAGTQAGAARTATRRGAAEFLKIDAIERRALTPFKVTVSKLQHRAVAAKSGDLIIVAGIGLEADDPTDLTDVPTAVAGEP